jgi:hypothetical protein
MSSKDAYQTIGLQGKRPSIEDNAKSTTQASSGRKNFSIYCGRTLEPYVKIGVHCRRTWRRQPRQLRRSLPTGGRTAFETAYVHAPLMLARDRRVLDAPLEERLQLRISELLSWATTMLPVINQNVRDTQAKLQTSHQDIRSYFSNATEVTTDHAATIPTATSPARPNVLLLDIRQRFQSARTRIATIFSDIRRYFPGIADNAT